MPRGVVSTPSHRPRPPTTPFGVSDTIGLQVRIRHRRPSPTERWRPREFGFGLCSVMAPPGQAPRWPMHTSIRETTSHLKYATSLSRTDSTLRGWIGQPSTKMWMLLSTSAWSSAAGTAEPSPIRESPPAVFRPARNLSPHSGRGGPESGRSADDRPRRNLGGSVSRWSAIHDSILGRRDW